MLPRSALSRQLIAAVGVTAGAASVAVAPGAATAVPARHPEVVPHATTDADNSKTAAAHPTCTSSRFIQRVKSDGVFRTRIPTSAGGDPVCILGQGNRGEGVRVLQRAINRKCYPDLNVAVDGIYGSETAGAVSAIQYKEGIQVDGVYGPETKGSMLWWMENIFTDRFECRRL